MIRCDRWFVVTRIRDGAFVWLAYLDPVTKHFLVLAPETKQLHIKTGLAFAWLAEREPVLDFREITEAEARHLSESQFRLEG